MEDLHNVVGCTVGCAQPSPIAIGAARIIPGTNDDGDTPAVIDADGTAAEVTKPVSTVTVPLAIAKSSPALVLIIEVRVFELLFTNFPQISLSSDSSHTVT